MAAVIRCGPGAVLSHASAGALLAISASEGPIQVSVPAARNPRPPRLRVHRRAELDPRDLWERAGIPVTGPVLTLIDLTTLLPVRRLEAAINAADKLGLIDPDRLRSELVARPRQRRARALLEMLDRRSFALTDSELERHFLPLARRAGLALPRTGAWLHGFKVDFFWPDLGLVVETDGLRYHRTQIQQGRDRDRDQVLTAAGLTCLRFTHAQVRYRPQQVIARLRAVAQLLAS